MLLLAYVVPFLLGQPLGDTTGEVLAMVVVVVIDTTALGLEVVVVVPLVSVSVAELVVHVAWLVGVG